MICRAVMDNNKMPVMRLSGDKNLWNLLGKGARPLGIISGRVATPPPEHYSNITGALPVMDQDGSGSV